MIWIFFRFFLNAGIWMFTFMLVPRLSFQHKNWPNKPKTANELLIRYSKGAISNTIRKSTILSASKQIWIEILTFWKKTFIMRFSFNVAYKLYWHFKNGKILIFYQFHQNNPQIQQFLHVFLLITHLVLIFFKNAFSPWFMKVYLHISANIAK